MERMFLWMLGSVFMMDSRGALSSMITRIDDNYLFLLRAYWARLNQGVFLYN